MRFFTKAILIAGISSIAYLIAVFPAAGACDKPLLLQKSADGTLSEQESKRLNQTMKWWLKRCDEFAEKQKSYLAFVESAEPDSKELWQRKEDFFNEALSLIQFGLEAYASLNDGMYPYSLGAFVCSGMTEQLPLNPFTGEPFKEKGLATLAGGEDSAVGYVPEYVRERDTLVVVGYWLVVVSPEICRLEPDLQLPVPAKALPGDWRLPPDTVLVLESHRAQ
jgi:hypothetical protein